MPDLDRTKRRKVKPTNGWTGYGVFYRGALVVWDFQAPVYWKRHLAAREADAHQLDGARVKKVRIVVEP